MTLTILLLGWALHPASSQETNAPRVRASLVTDGTEMEAGSTHRIGVRFEIEDGWHIYWQYPGGAGLATAVELELPDGLQVGPLRWPLPIAFDQSGGIPGYGYENMVVLAAEVTVPPDLDRRRAGKVRAEVSWLACKSVCVFGSAELESALADLPVYRGFDGWSRSLPEEISDNSAPFTLSTTGGLAEGVITLWLRWRDAPEEVEWFPNPSEAIEVGAVRIQTRGGLTRIDAEIKVRRGAIGTRDTLPSLVVITERDGSRRGWEVSVNLKNQRG